METTWTANWVLNRVRIVWESEGRSYMFLDGDTYNVPGARKGGGFPGNGWNTYVIRPFLASGCACFREESGYPKITAWYNVFFVDLRDQFRKD